MFTSYNPLLVGLSFLIAVTASFTALEVTRRVASARKVAARVWLTAGACAMGLGIWTMHFVGMLAMQSHMQVGYDITLTIASLCIAVGASAFAIFFAARPSRSHTSLALAGILLGLGIAGMHYTGMAAMNVDGSFRIRWGIAALSVGIAIAAAVAALWISASLATKLGSHWRLKLAASLVMAVAICGMHYVGMYALEMIPGVHNAAAHGAHLPQWALAYGVAAAATLILLATHLTLFLDSRLTVEESTGDRLRQQVESRTRALDSQADNLRRSKDRLERQIATNRMLTAIVEQSTDAICVVDADGRIEYVNPQFELEFQQSIGELKGNRVSTTHWAKADPDNYAQIHAAGISGQRWHAHVRSHLRDATGIDHDMTVSPIIDSDDVVTHYMQCYRNITDRVQMERRLLQAQKLESIGQLAAGVAHEINTPAQYIGDNTRFLQEVFAEVRGLLVALRDGESRDGASWTSADLTRLVGKVDIDYLIAEIPKAIDQSLDGISRVTAIVRAMKEFSHPAKEKMPLDLNRAIETTVMVATSEWKYVATLEVDLDPGLPPVPCLPSEINQVILNIIVNAAHSIGEKNEGTERRGIIGIKTRVTGCWAEIRISDTGAGIPEAIRARIFDPFFTTKPVGMGTGQGLNIAHAVVVQKHGGQIDVETKPGEGSCFVIRLPLDSPHAAGLVHAA